MFFKIQIYRCIVFFIASIVFQKEFKSIYLLVFLFNNEN